MCEFWLVRACKKMCVRSIRVSGHADTSKRREDLCELELLRSSRGDFEHVRVAADDDEGQYTRSIIVVAVVVSVVLSPQHARGEIARDGAHLFVPMRV